VVPGEEAVLMKVGGTVAAVIPHWNRRDLLLALLDNLKGQTRGFDEVLVCDNGSTDDSVLVAERCGARVLRMGANFGFAAAVNTGVKATDAEWVAVLNNDVELDADWLRVLLEAGPQWFATGKILKAADSSIIDGTFDLISRGACAWRCGADKADGPLWNEPRVIRMAPMTAVLIRRRLFDDAGLLDESFGSYLEDVDFGLRCALAGRSGLYIPSAVARHQGSATSGAWNKDTVRLIARNQVVLAAKYFRGQPRRPILAGQLLWGLVALRHGKGWAYLRGRIEGLRAARTVQPAEFSLAAVAEIVEESERQLFEVQKQSGFDGYWRIYFWLAR
jgi:GT2 family glycosyltransferase